MKKNLQFLFVCFLFAIAVNNAEAQINYTEDFETTEGWGGADFEVTDAATCNGSGSLAGNAFEIFGFVIPAEVVSPSIGTSDGNQVVLSYSYKLLEYDDTLPDTPTPNSPSWGNFTVEYSDSETGPWTLLETVNSANHIESADCALRSVIFTPAAGSQVYLRFLATPTAGSDYFLYLDDVSVITSTGCSGTPTASAATALNSIVCTNENVSLSLAPLYTQSGLTFQWQSSTDNVTYTNLPNASTMATYSGLQSAATWYRAIITCTASGQSVTSAPVQVGSTGAVCYCDVEFIADVEPITLVNFAGINNVTSAVVNDTPALEDFTALPPANIVRGQSYSIVLEGNTAGATFESFFKVFFDFNKNGSFDDAGESFEAGSITGSTGEDGAQAGATFMIPTDAALGLTTMRVIKLYDLYPEGGCPDETFGYGQAEDYTVNVQATAATADFSSVSFRYYPNPVNDMLNFSSVAGLQSVEVYNMLGQQVLAKEVSGNEATVNMASLTPGSYLVKVQANGGTKNIKIVKQ